MSLLQIAVLAVVQGLAELLPVSSSAHVVVAERLMGIDPSSPQMTFLLVMLHTGTVFAVILYFWPRWRRWAGAPAGVRRGLVAALVVATAATGVVGLALKKLIETVFLRGSGKQEIEALFSNLPLVAAALFAVGVLIVWAGLREGGPAKRAELTTKDSLRVGAVQGLCLPFRGFSRSGATISTALLCGVDRALAEDFSFALAVILTPPVVAREALRLMKAVGPAGLSAGLFKPGLVGMVLSFFAGLAALRWLSSWLETGRWRYFGYYCFAASAGVAAAAALLR